MAYGKRDALVRNVITHTLDPTLSSPNGDKVVPNYPDTNFAAGAGTFPDFPVLSPRLSPDGTRTALGSKQVWVGRLNMNLPPQFITVNSTDEGLRPVADTASTVQFNVAFDMLSTITVLASDPEGDALTYDATFLEPWMVWDAPTRTLTLVAPPVGIFYAKFRVTTPSGGTDAFIGIINVKAGHQSPCLTCSLFTMRGATSTAEAQDGPNPTHGRFIMTAPLVEGVSATLFIFDLSGRRVAAIRGRSGLPLVWDSRDETGSLVRSGVYLYRLEVGSDRQEGKVVVFR
jgi:hypothetical protein